MSGTEPASRTRGRPRTAEVPVTGVVDMLQVQALIERAQTAKDWAELKACIHELTVLCGYEKFLMHFELPYTGEQFSHFTLETYGPEWLDLYDRKNYLAIDPVVTFGINNNFPFAWHELTITDNRAMELFRDAWAHGLCTGMSVPTRSGRQGGAAALLNMSSSKECPPSYDRLSSAKAAAFLCAGYVLRRAEALAEAQREAFAAKGAPAPTDRQIEVLKMMGTGTTLKAIGASLGVTERAVQEVVTRACRSMGAAGREDALVRAAVVGFVGWSYRPNKLNIIHTEQEGR